MAEARAELNDLREAIDHYAEAVESADASFKVRAIEQLANLRVRNAVSEFHRMPPDGRDPAQTIKTIEDLAARAPVAHGSGRTTPERLSLQAGCWKRLAQVQATSPAADKALGNMMDCCDRAVALGGKDPGYPQLMACNARICVATRNGTNCDEAIGKVLRRLTDSQPPDDADFWEFIRWADAKTNVAIMEAQMPSEEADEIKDTYRRAWRHIGSPVKLRSVIEQLEFYEDVFADGTPGSAPRRTSIVDWVAELRTFLETEFLGKKPGLDWKGTAKWTTITTIRSPLSFAGRAASPTFRATQGGRTMKGVTQRVYDAWRASQGKPAADVKNIADAEVSAIYANNYWKTVLCNVLQSHIDMVQFDTAVNMGPHRAVKMLQQAVGVAPDG